jgi:Fe-S cluster assembly protein SufD
MAHALDAYLVEWERARPRWQRNGRSAIGRLRQEALQRFVSRGLPTTREEEWRFTSVAPIADCTFALAGPSAAEVSADDVASLRIAPAVELVFINGRHVPALSRMGSLPTGSHVENLANVLATGSHRIEPHLTRTPPAEQQPFVALNTAFLDDGAWIQVPAGAILEQPIHLLFLSTGGPDDRPLMSHPRILATLGENSQASVIETYAGTNAQYFTNVLTEIVVGDNAVLDHYTLQYDSPEAFHVGTIYVRTACSATYRSHSVSLGGALVRNDVTAVLNGEGAECTLNGLYAADTRRLVDNHTTIDHAQPHCGSREVYKGILADHARGVFNGKIIVRPDAQKTDAKQTNRALLLSEDAQINTKPQLEIFANDVKCTHGAAVGQLDEEALFYLRSRGLTDAEARRMLVHAFAADVLNRLPLEPVRIRAEERLQQQLARSLPAAA